MSLEHMVLRIFGVPFEQSEYCFVRHDSRGVAGHVGLDLRQIHFKESGLVDVGAVRFVVTRDDKRRSGVASALLRQAHEAAIEAGLSFTVAFSSVQLFFVANGYEEVNPGVMVNSLLGLEWPQEDWIPVGGRW